MAAILAAIYVRFTYLRNADKEYFQVKSSLNWFKTESQWMEDLINGASESERRRSGVFNLGDGLALDPGSGNGVPIRGEKEREREREMYGFVIDQLGKLEERLLAYITEAEENVPQEDGGEGGEKVRKDGKKEVWTIIPRGFRGRTGIAMGWLPVREKALELVRQREGLAGRVLFAQISMISSWVGLFLSLSFSSDMVGSGSGEIR